MENKPAKKAKLGELLIQQGYVTEEQIEQALVVQRRQGVYKPLGEICTDLGFISRTALRNLLAKNQKQILLGDLLINMGIVTEEQVTEALRIQRGGRKKLGRILVEKGFVQPSALADSLSIQLGMPKIAPNVGLIDETLLDAINPTFFQSKRVVPVCHDHERGVLTVIMDDPLDVETVADLEKVYRTEIEPAISSTGEVEPLLKQIFDPNHKLTPRQADGSPQTYDSIIMPRGLRHAVSQQESASPPMEEGTSAGSGGLRFVTFRSEASEPPPVPSAPAGAEHLDTPMPLGSGGLKFLNDESEEAISLSQKDLVIHENLAPTTVSRDNTVRILDFIISSAIQEKASDIHIEPLEKKVRVRYRIDGLLHHKTDLPKSVSSSLITRIKAICGLDIAERRKHQDGRIEARVMDKDVDLRVSTYAAIWGENIVIRILHRQSSLVDLNQIGFSPLNLDRYQRLLKYPAGVMLATGPTGSGKTTTLYASLLYLNDMERKIITVEDPVEYTIDGVIQAKLDPKLHLSYDDFIKSMMRQDPDVIMIGEIRDDTGAAAAIQAALTGHKVFSTFHTDDSTAGLVRLMNMGIETFLISSTVLAIVAQRLVRTLCPHCKEPAPPLPAILSAFHAMEWDCARDAHNFCRPQGCPECNNTGYKGRLPVQEVLEINDPVREAILLKKSVSQIRVVARQYANLLSMAEDGFYKAAKGLTTLEEVLRVVFVNPSDALVPYRASQIIELCDAPELQPEHPFLTIPKPSAA